jgi:hypothetical protein
MHNIILYVCIHYNYSFINSPTLKNNSWVDFTCLENSTDYFIAESLFTLFYLFIITFIVSINKIKLNHLYYLCYI